MTEITFTTERYHTEEIAPGVFLERLYPGGKDGPNGEVIDDAPGVHGWTDWVRLGDEAAPFQMALPDIRLPANQYWPLHWHDCWTFVLILEGGCLIGDWWMGPGDVFIAEPSLEYGPLVIGPRGCRLFEIFAQEHLSPGGYAPEFRDHPTISGAPPEFFKPRSAINRRNEGRQTLPLEGVPGFSKSRFEPGAQWVLGEADDPDRGVLQTTRLSPNEHIGPRTYDDWRLVLVREGELGIAGHTLAADDYLMIRPKARVPEVTAGPDGALLLEAARTARGLEARPPA